LGISELSRIAVAEKTFAPALAMIVYLAGKRLFDLLVAAIALVVISPLLALIALAIKLDSRGPIIFRQQRVLGGQSPEVLTPERQVFDFYKFRSMHVNNDPAAHREFMRRYMAGEHATNNGTTHRPVYKMKRDPRITRVGALLRRTSLDELPQLFNVVKGNMSLVGPRPALPYEVENYAPRARQRLTPQAGLTGLWQVSGRTCLTFDQMIELDVLYALKRSPWLDLKILLKTIPAVLSRNGAW
jgi:lipopolysaccharide/colanic/teichoic acid biosynthesis glycosyltransferase